MRPYNRCCDTPPVRFYPFSQTFWSFSSSYKRKRLIQVYVVSELMSFDWRKHKKLGRCQGSYGSALNLLELTVRVSLSPKEKSFTLPVLAGATPASGVVPVQEQLVWGRRGAAVWHRDYRWCSMWGKLRFSCWISEKSIVSVIVFWSRAWLNYLEEVPLDSESGTDSSVDPNCGKVFLNALICLNRRCWIKLSSKHVKVGHFVQRWATEWWAGSVRAFQISEEKTNKCKQWCCKMVLLSKEYVCVRSHHVKPVTVHQLQQGNCVTPTVSFPPFSDTSLPCNIPLCVVGVRVGRRTCGTCFSGRKKR